MNRPRYLAGIGLLAALLTASPARASIWTEVGNAGGLPSTAQATFPSGDQSLTAIFGALTGLGAAGDVDVYQIFIANPAAFSASTVNLFGTAADTQLFLFNAAGRGVYANDDASAATRRSTLPAGHPSGPQAPGIYYLAISSFDRDPVSVGGLIFPSFPFTSVFGPTGPGGASPVTAFAGGGQFQGTYRIDLTGAQTTPVPGPAAGLVFAGVATVAFWRRRRTT